MTVYVVYSEFNRGYDTEGSAVIEGVCLTEARAQELQRARQQMYWEECRTPVYGVEEYQEEDDDDWGVDVHIEAYEVTE